MQESRVTSKGKLGLVAVAIGLAVALVSWPPKRVDHSAGSVADPKATSIAEPRAARSNGTLTAATHGPAHGLSGTLPLRGVKTVSELIGLVDSDPAMRSQTLAELHQAIVYCEAQAIQMNHRSQKEVLLSASDPARREIEYRRKQFSRFCDRPSYSSKKVLDELIEQGPFDPVVQALELSELDDAAAKTSGLTVADRLARQAASPAALDKAFVFLLSQGRNLPATEGLPRPSAVGTASDFVVAQELAVRMVSCQVRGGCEAGGINTDRWCHACFGEVSLDEYWRKKYPPTTYEYARQVALLILRGDVRE